MGYHPEVPRADRRLCGSDRLISLPRLLARLERGPVGLRGAGALVAESPGLAGIVRPSEAVGPTIAPKTPLICLAAAARLRAFAFASPSCSRAVRSNACISRSNARVSATIRVIGQSSDASAGSGGGAIKLAAVTTAPNGEKVDPACKGSASFSFVRFGVQFHPSSTVAVGVVSTCASHFAVLCIVRSRYACISGKVASCRTYLSIR